MGKKVLIIVSLIYSLLTTSAFANNIINTDDQDEVFRIQSSLVNAGYFISIDGVWGNETIIAITNFQKDIGLNSTGDVDNDTLYALNRYSPEVSRGARKIIVETTGYTRYDDGCGDYTATGEYLRKGIVAVDPSIIPLGSRLYIPGYGMAIASDTGGAIIGNKVDLAFDYRNEAITWGRRVLTIYVL